MNFTTLHHQDTPLLIANVWDASSAMAASRLGYPALGTSSAAIAAMLGYDDGEAMPFDMLLMMVSRIRAVTTLPLSVDLEAGYSDTAEGIIGNIKRLLSHGVVGINLEDSRVVAGERRLEEASHFARSLTALHAAFPDLFINVRTDTFLLNVEQPLAETLRRGKMYAACGAQGLFVPGVTGQGEITTLAREVALPLNVMSMPELADFSTLATWGVRRISMGNSVHSALQTTLNALLSGIRSTQTFSGVYRHADHG